MCVSLRIMLILWFLLFASKLLSVLNAKSRSYGKTPCMLVVTHYSSNQEEQMEEVGMKKEEDTGDG